MSGRKWVYKPGEASTAKVLRTMTSSNDEMLHNFLDLTDHYSNVNPTKRIMVLNDNLETVFFVQMGKSYIEPDQVDVYIWTGEVYKQLPQDLAKITSKKYFDYVDVMSEAYEWLEGEI